MIQALPSAANIWTAESAAQALQALECTELFKLSSRSAQEEVRIAHSMVAAISEGRKPDVRAMERGRLCCHRCLCMPVVRRAPGQVHRSAFVWQGRVGQEAREPRGKKKAKTPITFAELQPLRVFSWLLTEQENAIVSDMVKTCTDKKELTPVAAAASSSSASSSAVKSDEKKQFESSAMEKALDMFN